MLGNKFDSPWFKFSKSFSGRGYLLQLVAVSLLLGKINFECFSIAAFKFHYAIFIEWPKLFAINYTWWCLLRIFLDSCISFPLYAVLNKISAGLIKAFDCTSLDLKKNENGIQITFFGMVYGSLCFLTPNV